MDPLLQDPYVVQPGIGGWVQQALALSQKRGYPITMQALRDANPDVVKLRGNNIQPGDTLNVPPRPGTAARTPAPTKNCPDLLDAAQKTLDKSRNVADTIVGPRATSDMAYWFARLYAYITQFEIRDKDKLDQPCFLLHFIPVFYDSYFVAASAFMEKRQQDIPAHWVEHFAMAGLMVDPSLLMPWVNAVTRSLVSGVTAHIKGDMAASLAKGYRGFSAKFTGVPSFDTFKDDFFAKNRATFEDVKLAIINEVVNRGTGLAAFGKSVNPNFAAQAGQILKIGLNIDDIYQWREDAWAKAKTDLGQ
jgi:hypothetical protein